jgi:hypothetical protein
MLNGASTKEAGAGWRINIMSQTLDHHFAHRIESHDKIRALHNHRLRSSNQERQETGEIQPGFLAKEERAAPTTTFLICRMPN